MGFLDDLNATIPVHQHLRRLGRQVESIFAEIHSRVEQEADGGEGGSWTGQAREKKGGGGRLARIALQARLTGYRKADDNSIPTCTLGKIIPGTLPPEDDDATFRVSLFLPASLGRQAS